MRLRFGTLCRGNPFNSRRSCDKFGCGHYGAPRKGGRHSGLDIVCSDGALVYAPFSGTIVRRSRPYGNGNAIDDGIQIQSGGLCVKLFYLRPWRTSGRVSLGQAIGTMLPMQKVFRGITSHVHVQMCDRSDPSRYF
ncbi:myeloid protein 1-like [Megalops cyprinoides]|uniref:myeloid protein 1-like n=1 Tax=Megalops cyprinoides TaxID=118141 RepID=UPI0018648F19|nr:myeloid protein 1-like [Megalops cyprinoides]